MREASSLLGSETFKIKANLLKSALKAKKKFADNHVLGQSCNFIEARGWRIFLYRNQLKASYIRNPKNPIFLQKRYESRSLARRIFSAREADNWDFSRRADISIFIHPNYYEGLL